MKRVLLRVVLASVLLLFAAPAVAQQALTGPQERGFTFEAHLGSRLLAYDFGVGGTLDISGVDGGFFAGYKIGRLMFGASVDYSRYAETQGADSSTDRFVFMPGVRVAILRSADQRVELYGQFDFGFGHAWATNVDGADVIMYQIAPGLRLWFHPNFAVGAIAGLRGEHYLYSDYSVGITSFFASLALTGVF